MLALGGAASFCGWRLETRWPSLRISKERVVFVLLWSVLIGFLWVSDYPAAWRVPEMVEYFAEMTLSAFRILCVTATGTILFGSMVALLYFTRPKSRRRPKLD